MADTPEPDDLTARIGRVVERVMLVVGVLIALAGAGVTVYGMAEGQAFTLGCGLLAIVIGLFCVLPERHRPH